MEAAWYTTAPHPARNGIKKKKPAAFPCDLGGPNKDTHAVGRYINASFIAGH